MPASGELPERVRARLKSRDARETLLIVQARLAESLGEGLMALWAHGSLVLGDFSETESDLDLVGVIDASVSAPDAARRAAEAFADTRRVAPWGARIDARFVRDGDGARPGARALAIVRHGIARSAGSRPRGMPPIPAADRAVLSGHGVALIGSEPAAAIRPPTRGELDEEMEFNLSVYWSGRQWRPWLFGSDVMCAFAATTLPRIVATIETGRVGSKTSALDRLQNWTGFEPLARWARARRSGTTGREAGNEGRLRRGSSALRLVAHARRTGLESLHRRRKGEDVLDR